MVFAGIPSFQTMYIFYTVEIYHVLGKSYNNTHIIAYILSVIWDFEQCFHALEVLLPSILFVGMSRRLKIAENRYCTRKERQRFRISRWSSGKTIVVCTMYVSSVDTTQFSNSERPTNVVFSNFRRAYGNYQHDYSRLLFLFIFVAPNETDVEHPMKLENTRFNASRTYFFRTPFVRVYVYGA